ncbi:unnamed protein product, partial [Discosporangium mesarthrocarpum]
MEGCGFCQPAGGGPGLCMQRELSGDRASSCPEGCDWSLNHCVGGYGWLAVLAMMAYLAFFGIGMSGIPWTVNAEIYPLHVRSLATSVATALNWMSNVAVSASFLTIASPTVLNKFGAFWLYAIIALLGWVWLFLVMPETSGLSLEEIKKLFVRPGDHIR